MRKFADYDLGCCKHLAVTLLDRQKEPIPGLPYEIRSGKKTLKKGKTDANGQVPKFAARNAPSYEVFVKRIEGGMKKISSFAEPVRSALITLISPKIAVEPMLEEHKGKPGSYKAGAAQKERSKPEKGKARTSADRGKKGNPVAVVHAPTIGAGKLSGAGWEKQYPTSTSLEDLTPAFREKVSDFLDALQAGGVKVRKSATYRPKERAYLMHYCCKIYSGAIPPDKVPPMDGVNIEWAHRDAKGTLDIKASKAAAKAMMDAYVIRYPAALNSRHTQRRAIDMTITGYSGKTIKDASGQPVELEDEDDLFELGKTYGVIKLRNDPPHWSDDGA